MGKQTRVLVVDDDETVRTLLLEALLDDGYEVLEAPGGAEALRVIHLRLIDLVILDLNMPGMDGVEVLRRVRMMSNLPVIILSARGQVEDKTSILDLGADDYITKPFVFEEVLSRVRAVLRRSNLDIRVLKLPVFDDGYLKIDFENWLVTVKQENCKLTKLENSFLRELLTSPGKIIKYDQLLENVWGGNDQDTMDSLKHCVKRLRDKLEPTPESPRYIVNVPQIGYVFRQFEQTEL